MIVMPMAGLSRRFFDGGYTKPKYMLPLMDRPLLDYALLSFRSRFEDTPFLIIFRDVFDTAAFVRERVAALGIRDVVLVQLDESTQGQADTVARGVERAGVPGASALTIFNIDTVRVNGDWSALSGFDGSGGWLEVFKGEGDNWSFVRPDLRTPGRALETAEKRQISQLCCTGLYHFERADLFVDAFRAALVEPDLRGPNGEIYVAPLYNHLIAAGVDVGYRVVPRQDVLFSGTPDEYQDLLAHPAQLAELTAGLA